MVSQLVQVHGGSGSGGAPIGVAVAQVVGSEPGTVGDAVLTAAHIGKGQSVTGGAAFISGVFQIQAVVAVGDGTGTGAGELELAGFLIGKAGSDVGDTVFFLHCQGLVTQVTAPIAVVVKAQCICITGGAGINDQVCSARINAVGIQLISLDHLRRFGERQCRQQCQNYAHRQYKSNSFFNIIC